jgi:hypothetical protein
MQSLGVRPIAVATQPLAMARSFVFVSTENGGNVALSGLQIWCGTERSKKTAAAQVGDDVSQVEKNYVKKFDLDFAKLKGLTVR